MAFLGSVQIGPPSGWPPLGIASLGHRSAWAGRSFGRIGLLNRLKSRRRNIVTGRFVQPDTRGYRYLYIPVVEKHVGRVPSGRALCLPPERPVRGLPCKRGAFGCFFRSGFRVRGGRILLASREAH